MDIDIPKLAAETAALLAPFLPYLIKGTKIAAKKAFEEAGKKFVDSVWDKAEELWGKLKPKVDVNPDAQKAIEKATRKPEDPRVLGNLELELEEIFAHDESFAQSIKAGNYSVVVGGSVENSNILNNSNNNRIVRATNYYENAPQHNIETEKSQKAFRSYLEKLRRHCNALPLAALGGDDSDEDITLDKIYIDLDTTLFINPETELYDEKSRVKRNERKSFLDKEEKLISVMEVAITTKQLVLLGDAGAGKSTFVKKLIALQAAVLLGEMKEPLSGFDSTLIPVFLVLRDLSPTLAALNLGNLSSENQKQVLSETILEKVRGEIRTHKANDCIPMIEEAFENGKILLVLDGLDEVAQDVRGRIRQAAGSLIQLHKIERVIITCRTRSYTGQAVFPNFQSFTIAPFDEEKIGQFAQAWYNEQSRLGHFNAEQAKERAVDLANKSSTSDLIEMSSNPMMLTSIAIIHQKDIGLPNERVKLYQLIVDVLIKRWQKHKLGDDSFAPSQALTAFLKNDDKLQASLKFLPMKRIVQIII